MALPPGNHNQVTDLLLRWSQGDGSACERLFPLVYDELKRVARRSLAGERRDHTLQSTALVHEAYLRLIGNNSFNPTDRVHFFAIAAQLMRRILVDHARMRSSQKRGGKALTVTLNEAIAFAKPKHEVDLIALDKALHELARMDPQQAQIVEMRFFAGLSIHETSRALGISLATVKRDWATARAWLYREMKAAG